MVLTREDTGIASYEDLKGRPVGGTAGTFEALALEKDSKAWGDAKGSFRAYQSEADTALAISQGHIDCHGRLFPPSPPRGSSRASTRA